MLRNPNDLSLSESQDAQKTPPATYIHCVLFDGKESLLARGNEHALFLRVVGPSARSRFAAVLLREPLDPLLEFGSEMPDETL